MRPLPLLLSLLFLLPGPSLAQDAEIVLRNGLLLTQDPKSPRATAIAIQGGRILAVGSDSNMKRHIGPSTKVIDLQRYTVVPGLIDTHAHAIRGGQTYTFETYWHDEGSLAAALAKLGRDASARPVDQWVAVVGSWHPEQFDEGRGPTRADLDQAVPDHPAYVQYLYDYAQVNSAGVDTLGLDSPDAQLPPGITVERDANGQATGRLLGGIGPFNALFAWLSQTADHYKSLKTFFADLNARGVTGFIDPSAGPPETYQPLFLLRDRGELTLRAGYRIPAVINGGEAEWFRHVMAYRPPRHDDGQIAFLGLGENLVTAMNDGVLMAPGFNPSAVARDELAKVARFAAEQRIPLEIHAYTDDAASAILDAFEEVARDHDLRPLRWSIAHLNTGSDRTLQRMARLGLAYSVQMGPYFETTAIHAANSADVAASAAPVSAALELGIPVAGGTDSTRIGVAGVWHAIQYHVDGQPLAGVRRQDDNLISRDAALRMYTRTAAWLSFAEETRGSLEPGKLADLVVLDQPYLTMPAKKIHTLRSLMTFVGGRAVHDSGALSVE
ncbi:N-substituted formamide deformylase precursor [compost metagenome]